MKSPSIFYVVRSELFSLWSIFFVSTTTLLYIILILGILNYRLIGATIVAHYPLTTKIAILCSLLGGLFTAFSISDTIILLASAFLVGVNILLIGKTIYAIEQNGPLKFSVGGATLIGLISTGCSSCGFSLLSILGLSTSLSFLPFHGMELHSASLVLLFFSALYMIRKLRDSIYCKRK